MKAAMFLSELNEVSVLGDPPSWKTGIPFDGLFSGKKPVQGLSKNIFYFDYETEPYRHPRFGLGWKCRWHDRDDIGKVSPWFLVFFDEPQMLIQELKASEFEQKKKRRKK